MSDQRGSPTTSPRGSGTLWLLATIVLLALVALDFFVPHHAHFGVDGTPGFGAWYAFAASVAIVAAGGVLGLLLKRQDTYYDD